MTKEDFQTKRETTVTTSTPPQARATDDNSYAAKKTIFRAYQIIWYILGIVIITLGFRFVFLLLGANNTNGFVNFIYSISSPLVSPFAGIFGITETFNQTFEWSTLIAMVVYTIVVYGVVGFFQIVKPTDEQEVESVVDNQ